jgi:hypothetical protein
MPHEELRKVERLELEDAEDGHALDAMLAEEDALRKRFDEIAEPSAPLNRRGPRSG